MEEWEEIQESNLTHNIKTRFQIGHQKTATGEHKIFIVTIIIKDAPI